MHLINILALVLPAAIALPNPALQERQLSYQQGAVYHHNLHRFSSTEQPQRRRSPVGCQCANTALKIAKTCNFAHRMDEDGGGYGQNIAAGILASNVTYVITNMWYNGEVNAYSTYSGKEPSSSDFGKYGQFMQVVWNGTTKLGCATKDCSASGLTGVGGNVPPIVTVCNYMAPGNYLGQFATNVGKPLNKATVNWSAVP